jgi:hypothetical protein
MVGEIIEITQQALQNDKALVEVVAEVAVARKVFLFGQQQYNYVGASSAPGRKRTYKSWARLNAALRVLLARVTPTRGSGMMEFEWKHGGESRIMYGWPENFG